ncbi:Major facilitator superfamily domain, general substrate transporter [Metarhizium rileyi]|uniref:Major facilitator superfamily domain, general substrate transporter n=1 Tax=Metarhizium rileyi (strain RCEF 4871) TaxID=1649241 RepID=A0A162HTQ7_METRR|nr:Major facilitator superfamily domain, general substrate transporter [Metarhizium rileyi RCEF 4871]
MAGQQDQDAQNKRSVVESTKASPTSEQRYTAGLETGQDGSPAARLGHEVNESSPLLSSNGSDSGDGALPTRAPRQMDETQETKGLWYMILLTVSMGGLQLAWAVELSNGSPYLLSLGLSKSLMALVWIAGPLTGSLVVPYVGIISDNCRIRWGKRRPFMVGGTIATVAGLMFLAWAREIVGGILGVFGASPKSEGVKVVTIVAAVIGVYVLDIAINTVQAAIRAFFVDCAPAHQQEEANAMASRATGIGNIIGFVAGYVNLPTYLWFLGNNQFKILCAVASIGLAITISVSTTAIQERDPRADGSGVKKTPNIVTFFFNIVKSIKRLPPQTKRVCQVQFFAWVGFFPLLFYTSSYIGEIYVQPYLEQNPNMTPEELEALYEQATRIGTFALLINAIVSLLTNVFLPFFIAPTFDSQLVSVNKQTGQPFASRTTGLPRRSCLDYLRIPGFTLKRAWLGSLLLFAVCMFCTVLVQSVAGATALIGLAGITWAMALWAPWAIISGEISRRDVISRAKKLKNMAPRENNDPDAPSSSGNSQDMNLEIANEDEDVDQAGVILGIHNMAIAVPQMIATVGSSVVFKFLQKPRGTPGDHSFAIVMALGGVFVLASCVFAIRIRDDVDATDGAVDDEARGALLNNGNTTEN